MGAATPNSTSSSIRKSLRIKNKMSIRRRFSEEEPEIEPKQEPKKSPVESLDQRKEKIRLAVEAVRNETLILERAAVIYNIPKTTLHDHLNGKSKKFTKGRNNLYTDAEEKIIHDDLIKALQEEELSVIQCRHRVLEIIENRGLENKFFSENHCGRKWFEKFCTRHKLDIRSPPLTEKELELKTLPPRKRYLETYLSYEVGEIARMDKELRDILREVFNQ